MKTKVLILLMFVSCYVSAQISTKEKPIGLKMNIRTIQKSPKSTKIIHQPNIIKLRKEDEKEEGKGIPPRFGYRNKVNFNLSNSGEWITLKNGDKLWRLNIQSKGALSLNLLYNKFWLPKGGKLFIYGKNGKQSIGAFTSVNNNGTRNHIKGFATGLIYSDNIIVEYWQPANVKEQAIISISYVVYGYRYINIDNRNSRRSGKCQVNINCSEGDDWQKEKEAIALILVNGNRYCTGSLINTTEQNLKPLFLTADHCLGGWANDYKKYDAVDNPDMPHYSFYWHYEYPNCKNESSEPPIYSTVGAKVIANNSISDFALLELKEDPRDLDNFTPYYLGWDRTNIFKKGGVGIHHPQGDVKKIATYNIVPYASECKESSLFLDVSFTNTTNGFSVMEPGSSGSPLINSEKRVIGQLYGPGTCSQARCDAPSLQRVAYGRFSISWTGDNSSNKHRRLKDWLDPKNTGVSCLNGKEWILSPKLIGADIVCNKETYLVKNLPKPAIINWKTSNNNLQLISHNDSTAVFKKKTIGTCKVIAQILGVSKILKKDVIVSGIPEASDMKTFSNKQLSEELPQEFLNKNFNFDFVQCYQDDAPTLYSTVPNILGVNSVFDILNDNAVSSNGYEWRIKSGSADWTIEPVEIVDNVGITILPNSFIFLTSKSLSTVILPDAPVLEVRLHTPCGVSEWTEVSGFDVKNCDTSGLFYLLTPNGDGINDTFELTELKSKKKRKPFVATITISNKKGEVVYQQSKYMKGKERFRGIGNIGKQRNVSLPTGIYSFKIKGKKEYSGKIYIKR